MVTGVPIASAAGPAAGGSSSTLSAASRPEISTIGTPTPGTVPEPVNTSPGTRRSTLVGRNGPVWRNVWASENGVPRSIPAASQSSGS
jgi:hypothetical protein